MRDDHDGRIERRELVLEPLERVDVEMVRRLVEKQQIGVAGERPRKRRARQLTARERIERTIEIGVPKPEPAQCRRGLLAPRPAARVLQPSLRLRVARHRLRPVIAVRHRLLQPAQLLLDRHEVGSTRQRVLAQREVLLARWPLVVERHARAFGERELAALDRRFTDERAQQRRLASTVRARERQPIASVQREGDAVEKWRTGEFLAEI